MYLCDANLVVGRSRRRRACAETSHRHEVRMAYHGLCNSCPRISYLRLQLFASTAAYHCNEFPKKIAQHSVCAVPVCWVLGCCELVNLLISILIVSPLGIDIEGHDICPRLLQFSCTNHIFGRLDDWFVYCVAVCCVPVIILKRLGAEVFFSTSENDNRDKKYFKKFTRCVLCCSFPLDAVG